MVQELPAVLYEAGSPHVAGAVARSAEILNRIASALSPGPGELQLFRGGTLMVSAVDPVMVFGSGTYLHDVLVALGGSNAASARGWATLSLEDVVRLNPQAIIIVREPGANGETDLQQVAGPLMKLDIDAVRDGRVAVLRHPDAFTPSTGIIGVASELRAILRRFGENGS
jgi:ABC-type Fe3+-hydroxamate transport system substrate-binding protein